MAHLSSSKMKPQLAKVLPIQLIECLIKVPPMMCELGGLAHRIGPHIFALAIEDDDEGGPQGIR
jgi:hypothetical protein